jgi:hypothetical protein
MSNSEITLSEFLDEKERAWLERFESTVIGEPEGKQFTIDPADCLLFQKLPRSKFEASTDPEQLAAGYVGALRLKGGEKKQEILCKVGVGQGWVHIETPGVVGRKIVYVSNVVLRGLSSQRKPG